MQEKGIVCRTSPSLAFVSHFCLISRELKTASSGAYSPGTPIQLLPHDVPCANKNSSVLILLQDYPPFPTRIHRLQRQQCKKSFFSLPLLYPLRKIRLRSHANKNFLSLIIGRFLRKLTLYIKKCPAHVFAPGISFFFLPDRKPFLGCEIHPVALLYAKGIIELLELLHNGIRPQIARRMHIALQNHLLDLRQRLRSP